VSALPADRLLNSPRAQRRMMVFSAVVLLAGAAAFLTSVVFDNRATPVNQPSSTSKAARSAKRVKPSTDAYAVVREFLQTAVRRRNMHEAYNLVAAPLKSNESRKEWERGNNEVAPYPVNNARTAAFHPITSTKNHLYLWTELSATKASGLNAFTFDIGVRKVNGKWLVDYFEAENPYGGSHAGGSLSG
jgi:hypothetical protein